jgi:hypothetical protein
MMASKSPLDVSIHRCALEIRRILLAANERVDSLLQHRDLMLLDAQLIDVALPTQIARGSDAIGIQLRLSFTQLRLIFTQLRRDLGRNCVG